MKVSIVGGSGFIGTRLVELLLQRGNEVVIVDKAMSAHYPALTRIADVRDEAALDQVIDADSDVVIHLAAEHKDNVHPIELYYEVNVQGMRNLLSVLGRKGIKQIVFTSSVAIYGLNEGDSTEESPIAPFNDYGKSKYQAEQVLAEWTAQDITRSAVVLRPCVVFGERNRGNVYNLLHSIVNKSFMMVGKGNNHKSMGYVGNLCEFITFLLTHGIATGVEVYNYADKPDQIIVSGTLLDEAGVVRVGGRSIEIYAPDYLQDRHHRPRRSFQGTHYTGGFSDHYPVYVDLIIDQTGVNPSVPSATIPKIPDHNL